MALWQFDFFIVPKKLIVKDMVIKDTIIGDEILSWKLFNGSLFSVDFLEKYESWSENIVQYGKADETCVEFMYDDGVVEEISCRLDLRLLSKKLLEQILSYINSIEGVIFYDNKIISPDTEEVIEIMKCSRAYKFCRNPRGYFEEISKHNNLHTD